MVIELIKYSKLPIYTCWVNMKQRCYNHRNDYYNDYGGRGIRVCDEWKDDFFNFYAWAIRNGYSDGLNLRLDRENNNDNYAPHNCRWVTETVNQNNKRSNVYFDYNGAKLTLPEIGRITGLCYKKLWHRINRQGKTLEEAVSIGNDVVKYHQKVSGIKRCKEVGVRYSAVRYRMRKYKENQDQAIAYYLSKVA